MKIKHLGVGEAFDEVYGNNAITVCSDTNLLIDCGYAVPRYIWLSYPDKDFLDAIYLTHAHADHYMGLPALLVRMLEEGRVKPLKIISHNQVLQNLPTLLEYAYHGCYQKLSNFIDLIEIQEDSKLAVNDLNLEFAPTNHSISNYAVKVKHREKIVCFSGDGKFSEKSKKLYRNSDLVVHEAFGLEDSEQGHDNMRDVIEMCEEIGVKNLALTHLQRRLRKNNEKVLEYINKKSKCVRLLLPVPLDEITL